MMDVMGWQSDGRDIERSDNLDVGRDELIRIMKNSKNLIELRKFFECLRKINRNMH